MEGRVTTGGTFHCSTRPCRQEVTKHFWVNPVVPKENYLSFFLDVECSGTACSVVQVESKYVFIKFVFSVLTGIMKIKINFDKI